MKKINNKEHIEIVIPCPQEFESNAQSLSEVVYRFFWV